MQAVNAVKERKNIRVFKANSVEKVMIETILKSAVYAPSSMNPQPWEFTEVVDELLERFKEAKVKNWIGGYVNG